MKKNWMYMPLQINVKWWNELKSLFLELRQAWYLLFFFFLLFSFIFSKLQNIIPPPQFLSHTILVVSSIIFVYFSQETYSVNWNQNIYLEFLKLCYKQMVRTREFNKRLIQSCGNTATYLTIMLHATYLKMKNYTLACS